jgi:hypothetical protein
VVGVAAAWVGNESPGLFASGIHPLGPENQQTPGKHIKFSELATAGHQYKALLLREANAPITKPSSLSTPVVSRAMLAVPQLEADAKCQRWAGSARWAGWAGQEITLRVPSAWRPVVPDSRCHSSEYHQSGSTQPPHRLEHSFQRAG